MFNTNAEAVKALKVSEELVDHKGHLWLRISEHEFKVSPHGLEDDFDSGCYWVENDNDEIDCALGSL